jgi:Kef-type K+ transport system membrane component KefB
VNNSNLESAAEREEQHERWTKLVGGYTAFVAALLIATFAKSNDYPRSRIVISLLALSLPSLVAQTLLDYKVRVVQGRQKSLFRGLAAALGFFPSLAAIAILIGHFSSIAAALFLFLTLFWALVMDIVTFLGASDPKSDV